MPRVCRKTERKDYSDLLRELQGKPAVEEETVAESKKQADTNVPKRKPAVNDEQRNRLMSNEANRFVYVPKWNTIHDKSCPSVKRIATEDLEFKHDLVPGAKQCPACELRRCLRLGARDGLRVKQYQEYFESLGLTKEVYNRLYIKMGAQTRLMNDTLIIWYKEEAWKVERVHVDNRVILWHNNYYVDKNYVRVFYGGFHKQFPEGVTVSFKTALKHIEGYAPTVHIVERKIKKIQPQIDAAREYFKAKDAEEKKRQSRVILRMMYHLRRFWSKMPWGTKIEEPNEIEGFTLVGNNQIPGMYSEELCGYIWKSANEDFFFDVGKLDQDNQKLTTMFSIFGAKVGVENVVAYRTIE